MHAHLTRRLFLAGSSASVVMLSRAIRASAQESIDEVRWALPAVNDTMFVPRAWSTYVGAIMSLVQEGPLAFADDLSLTPAVAESWKQTDDTTYMYTLRQGVTFGDGCPLTADDVVASFQYHMNPKSGSQLAAFFSLGRHGRRERRQRSDGQAEGAERPVPVHAGAHGGLPLQEEASLRNSRRTSARRTRLPLGTGPYKLVEFSPADRVVLEARDDYWGPKPVAKRIVFSSIPDRQTRLLAMQERRHRRHVRPRDLRHRPVEGAGQCRCHHRAVARRLHADHGPVGARRSTTSMCARRSPTRSTAKAW